MKKDLAKVAKVLISEDELKQKIKEVASQITNDYEGEDVLFVGILKGCINFYSDLTREVTLPITMDFMAISSYGSDTKSSGIIKIVKDLDESITGKDVLVVEDIVDSGRTLSYLLMMLKERQPNSLKLCTLLDKPDRRVVDVDVHYTGFQIPDEFVVGYGLDYAQKYRNLPYVGVVHLNED